MKPFRNERSHCEDQKEVQNWAIKVVSDVSELSGDQTFAFVIQNTCGHAVCSIYSIIKGSAYWPASLIHTSVQWVLMLQIPKPGCIFVPLCHTVASPVSCLSPRRTCQYTSLRTEDGYPSVGYLTSAWRRVSTHTHTHTGTRFLPSSELGVSEKSWLPVKEMKLRPDQ